MVQGGAKLWVPPALSMYTHYHISSLSRPYKNDQRIREGMTDILVGFRTDYLSQDTWTPLPTALAIGSDCSSWPLPSPQLGPGHNFSLIINPSLWEYRSYFPASLIPFLAPTPTHLSGPHSERCLSHKLLFLLLSHLLTLAQLQITVSKPTTNEHSPRQEGKSIPNTLGRRLPLPLPVHLLMAHSLTQSGQKLLTVQHTCSDFTAVSVSTVSWSHPALLIPT